MLLLLYLLGFVLHFLFHVDLPKSLLGASKGNSMVDYSYLCTIPLQ